MHDSEQEHSGITGCRVTYESTIFYNEANKFSIIVVKTSDPRIPPQACSGRYYGDRMLRFTAVGYELPRTKAVELELDGEWVESKYGYQLQVEQWQEIVPQTADGLLAYLGSGLIKGIGPKTAEDIVATFGPDTLNILDNEPEKLLQIRGITEGKLKDIEESYAESRVLRNLMSLLGPFKITPATALKIYQNFGPACVDILKNCPYDLCQISGFGFKRVDGIVRKTDNRLHSAERIKGAVLYTLEDARGKSGHLFLPSEDLVKETLLLLNAPIPIPEQRVRAEEVQETLQQMILHGAVVAYKQYLYSPRVFGQEDDTARMIAERLAAQQLSFLGGNVVIRILAQILKFPADKNFFALFAVFSLTAGCTVRAAGAVLAAVNRDFALCTVLRMGGIVRTEIQMSAVLADKAVIRFVIAHVFHSANL